jgi:Lrp/AsnC family transcriptional regulator for asnA, asnC and gidA
LELDKIDRRILEKLREDARMPFTEIARDLKMSDPAVHVRVKKLTEEGIIQGYTARVDQRALGREVYGFVLINVEPGALEDVASHLVENENVDAIYEIHGQNDLSVKIWARDLDEMRELMLKIREIPHVRSTELTTILKVWKERSF